MAEEKRLIGDDGRLARGSLAETAEDTTFAEGSWYKIATKAVAASVFGDLDVTDFYYAPIDVSATSGDTAYLLTLADMVDLSGWSLELTGDEVEVTVLQDNFKKYRKGKLDANGSASFVFIKGETDQPDNLANYYFDIVEIDESGVVTVSQKKTDTLYLVGFLAEEDAGEVTLATVMEVEFFNFSLPMNSSEAVNMDIPFRLIGDTNPVLYRISNPDAST
jgi:hypothetical protein